jgi:hypothetical protein
LHVTALVFKDSTHSFVPNIQAEVISSDTLSGASA